MTKEELKKEAIQYAVDYPTNYGKGYKHKDLRIAYLAGAEPREKQIQINAEQIRALQKQNGELTDELTKKADTNHQLVEQLAKMSEENAELKTDYEVLSCSVGDFGELQDKLEEEQGKNNGLSDNLAKAKELLGYVVKYYREDEDLGLAKEINEAEQFLKEE